MPETFDSQSYWDAVGGDRDAVSAIVEEHSSGLIRLAMCMGLPHGTAEDVVHGTWMRFFRHLADVRLDQAKALREPASLPFWLKQVTRNGVRDVYRTGRRRRELADRLEAERKVLGDFVYQPEDADRLTREEQKRAMWGALQRLDETCRTILLLRLEDPPASYKDIAKLLGRSEGAIGPTYGRCIEKLRKAMGVGANRD